MPPGARNWLTPAAWVAAVTAILLLLFPFGFPNYDTVYSLLWGTELADGLQPDRGAALPRRRTRSPNYSAWRRRRSATARST